MIPGNVIPSPSRVRWREFRERQLPYMVFAALCVLAACLWRGTNSMGTVVGVGEGHRAQVLCHRSGWIGEILVEPYQTVQAGDPLAVVHPYDPSAQTDLMGLELDIARLRRQATVPEQNMVGYERVRLEWLNLQAELAGAKVKLGHAEKEVARSVPLFEQKLVSATAHELAVRERDVYHAEVVEKSKAVAEMAARLQQLRAIGDPSLAVASPSGSELATRLEQERVDLATNLAPVTLRAPMAGMIGRLERRTGEFLLEGEMFAQVQSPESERVVAYLRQPYALDLEPGMAVSLSTRTRKKQQFASSIAQVGAQCEFITNSLATVRLGQALDAGLPFTVRIPSGVRIRPGELVDLVLHPQSPANGL